MKFVNWNKWIYTFVVLSAVTGALFLIFSQPILSQTSRWSYIVFCYYNPLRIIKKDKGFLHYDQNFTGVWYDWTKNGELARTTEVKKGFQNGKQIDILSNTLVSDGVEIKNLFSGIKYHDFYKFYLEKKYIKDNIVVSIEKIDNRFRKGEKSYFQNGALVKTWKFIDEGGDLTLEIYDEGKLKTIYEDIIYTIINRPEILDVLNDETVFLILKELETDKDLFLENSFECILKDKNIKTKWQLKNGSIFLEQFLENKSIFKYNLKSTDFKVGDLKK